MTRERTIQNIIHTVPCWKRKCDDFNEPVTWHNNRPKTLSDHTVQTPHWPGPFSYPHAMTIRAANHTLVIISKLVAWRKVSNHLNFAKVGHRNLPFLAQVRRKPLTVQDTPATGGSSSSSPKRLSLG